MGTVVRVDGNGAVSGRKLVVAGARSASSA